MARSSVEILRRHYPEDDPRLAQAEMVLGAALTLLDRYDEAEKLLLRSYRVLREQRGADEPPTKAARDWLISHYYRRGLFAKADELRQPEEQ